jgi:hypothetical protein
LRRPGASGIRPDSIRNDRRSNMRAAVVLSLFLLLVGCVTPPPSETVIEPLGKAGQKWSVIEESPQMVAFFRGTFDTLNFTVNETGERFFLVFSGERVTITGGRAGLADLDVPIGQIQVDAVARLAADGTLDRQDAFSVMQILYGPIARAFLTGSFLKHDIVRRLAGVEDLIHITFWTPGLPDSSSVTLKAEGGQWYVIDGLVGRPKRVFRLNEAETLEYMRRVHATRKSSNPKVWIDFVNWYTQWRERVSVVPATVSSRPGFLIADRRDHSSQGIQRKGAQPWANTRT